MNSIATVAIGNSTREFDREYDYRIPAGLQELLKPGMRVIVPFGGGNKPREAYIIRLSPASDCSGLKEIRKVLDETPVLSSQMLHLAAWMKEQYICTFSDAVKCMLPAGIGIKALRIACLAQGHPEVKQNSAAGKIVRVLIDNANECEYETLKRLSGIKGFSGCVKKLEDQGVLRIFEEYTSRVREKTVRVAYLAMPQEEVAAEIESDKIKKIQQIRVLEMLMENEYIATSDIVRFAGVSVSVLGTLKKYGFIDFKDIEILRDPVGGRTIEQTPPQNPTPEQHHALTKMKELMNLNQYAEILLHGVTGSGKTEVYMQLIRQVLDQEKQAIVLVPEISLTPQMVERFKGRFGKDVAVLHSRLSLGERYDQWRLIRDGKIKVVVGARSAIFAPLSDLGVVIIDEEHENSYKSETTPKYHAAEIAQKRCQDAGAILLYGSATPSVETYYRAVHGGMVLLELKERANSMTMPQVHIVDMRDELEQGNRSIFSNLLFKEMEENVREGRQTILFLNRRGFASFVLCRDCGFVVKCINCNITMTYHAHEDRLICHYCGYTYSAPKTCPACKSARIRHFGTGTQKLEEEVKKIFPGSPVIRMDMDTTSCKNAHEDLLRRFREENVPFLIGTQMIAKGHDFPNVTLVGVIAADNLLNTGDYRAAERTFQLLTQVAGRAGRGRHTGRVVVQTYNVEDFSIIAACNHNYDAFYSQEAMIREKLGYPPFSNIAVVVLSGFNDKLTFVRAKSVKDAMTALFAGKESGALVLGPARSPLSKIRNKYRWRIIIKCMSEDLLLDVLTKISDEFHRKREKDGVELGVDINPVNMV